MDESCVKIGEPLAEDAVNLRHDRRCMGIRYRVFIKLILDLEKSEKT